jgi:hypothetical protein
MSSWFFDGLFIARAVLVSKATQLLTWQKIMKMMSVKVTLWFYLNKSTRDILKLNIMTVKGQYLIWLFYFTFARKNNISLNFYNDSTVSKVQYLNRGEIYCHLIVAIYFQNFSDCFMLFNLNLPQIFFECVLEEFYNCRGAGLEYSFVQCKTVLGTVYILGQ